MVNLSDRAFGIGLVERAAKDGVAGWTARDRSTLIANAFFADRSRSERYKIELTFDDLIHQIAELIEKQGPLEMRETLGTVLSELKFVRDGFAPGKRPRRGRTVGPDTLTVLLGRLPAALMPPAWAGVDFGDFGGVGVLAESLAGDSSEVRLTSAYSPLLEAYAFLYDGLGMSARFARTTRERRLESLDALEAAAHAARREAIRAEQLRALPDAQLDELRRRAEGSINWLKTIFSIESDNDPLNLTTWQLLMPNATGQVLFAASELFAGGLDDGEGGQLNDQLAMGAVQDNGPEIHSDALNPIYWHVYEAIRHVARGAAIDGAAFSERAHAIGLLEPDSDAFDRYTTYFVRMFQHVQAIYRARIHIISCLSRDGAPLALGSRAPLEQERFVVEYEDYHRLGRWSDYLKGLLKLGLVERGRDAGVRLRLPQGPRWEFPSVPFDTPVDRLTRLVVEAARRPTEVQEGDVP